MILLLLLPCLLTGISALPVIESVAVRVSPTSLRELTQPLAVARQVGTRGHQDVREYIVGFVSSQPGWQVELDTFEAQTPIGRKRFDNIIATLSIRGQLTSNAYQPRQRRLVLAAHYDSKRLPGFVGAIDSAVSCAILLQAAEMFGRAQEILNEGVDILQLVFFDGEEAFNDWTASDSLYGSRHLARKWAQEGTTEDIKALLLLDLIGGPSPKFFFSPFPGVSSRVTELERTMFTQLAATEAAVVQPSDRPDYFQLMTPGSGSVQDDHTPFHKFGVPTVHVIPQPFPSVWHTPADTLEAVHWTEAADVATIVLTWAADEVGLKI